MYPSGASLKYTREKMIENEIIPASSQATEMFKK